MSLHILNKYSDFKIVNNKSHQLYNRPVFVSTRKDRKYMIINDNNKMNLMGSLKINTKLQNFRYKTKKNKKQPI